VTFVFTLSAFVHAEVIFFEDFEDSSGFTTGGGGALYWGTAPLDGTVSVPSYFTQGVSGQSGTIFYGALAKEYQGSPAATVTIELPDLTGYTNLQLAVALAAPSGVWENTHRDSLHILGGTTNAIPYVDCSVSAGCMPITGAIDNFLPAGYGAPLRSQFYSIDLNPEFHDFTYAIDSSLKAITFAFASTGYDEVVGIDSVKIMGTHHNVPEPSTVLLLLFSAGLFGGLKRKFKV
jgi:hypothetical protein